MCYLSAVYSGKLVLFQIQSLHLIKDFFRQEHKVGRQQQKKYFLGDMSPIRGGGGGDPSR